MEGREHCEKPMRGQGSYLSGVDIHLDNFVLNVAIMCTFGKFETLSNSKKSSHNLLQHFALYICNFRVIRKEYNILNFLFSNVTKLIFS